MTKKIEDKLLLLRAKKFADSIEGIDSIFISLLGNDMLLWHRDKLTIANAIDNGNGRICFEQPARMDELIRAVISTLGIEGGFSCWLVYEGRCGMLSCLNNAHSFLTSIFRTNNTYDISLIFESPEKVISISDNEYNVDIYYEIK